MTTHGVSNVAKIDGRMNEEMYCDILEQNLSPTVDSFSMDKDQLIFQQDNGPKHTSKRARKWLEDKRLSLLPWPPQSPDLNPIKHLWDIVKRRLNAYPSNPAGIQELWQRIQTEWPKIGKDDCMKLIESMPNRVQAVLKAKGGFTTY